MKQFLMFCALAIIAAGDCKDSHDMMEKDPWVKVTSEVMKEGAFEVKASWMQGFPMGDKPTKTKHMISLKNMAAQALGKAKVYLVWNGMDDCLDWIPANANKSDFLEVVFPEAPQKNATAAPTVDVAIGDIGNLKETMDDMKSMMEDMENVKTMEVDVDIFKLLKARLVVVYNGTNYCAACHIDKSEGMNEVHIMFSNKIEMNRESFVKILSEKLEMDKKFIFIGNMEMTGECRKAQVYINKKFDNDMLKKALVTFKSMSGLGVYSPTEKCQSDVKNSFIVRNILKMFVEGKLENEDDKPSMTTCAGVSAKVAAEYKVRLAKYDCMVAQYTKKYGMSVEGCRANDGRQWEHNKGDGKRESKDKSMFEMPRCNCNATSYGVDPEFEMYYTMIMQALGAPLYDPELVTVKAELRKAIDAQSTDTEKITKLVEKVKGMEEKLKNYYHKTAYAMCMVAGYGDMSLDKFKAIKEKVSKGEDEDKILKDLLHESLTWLMEMKKTSSKEEVESSEMKKAMMTKLKIIFRINGDCSKESDRKRVWMMLYKMNDSVPQYLSKIGEKIDIPEITQALNGIKMEIMSDPHMLAGKIFFHVYSSVEFKENDPLIMSFKTLFSAMKNNSEMLAVKAKEFMKDADVEKLMLAHILMLPKEYLEKECNLKAFAEKIMADMKTSKPCSQSAGDMWSNYDNVRPQNGMGSDEYYREDKMGRMPLYNRRGGQLQQWRDYYRDY